MATTLACCYLGMVNKLEPTPELVGNGYAHEYELPRSLNEAIDLLRETKELHEVLGSNFITLYTSVKELEYAEFMRVISPWERQHLLLHV
jgi:glutamine synthetase